ncbi:response regulator [candidate division KSB1 bacterium]|nr:response regulator [candidate division KSB1 bacterium]
MSRIMIVDDDPRYLELLGFALQGEGFETVLSTDPEASLELAARTAPDLIISDVSMPHEDGFTFATELRADPRTREIPLMFLSARGLSVDRHEGQRHGAVEYLTKPFSPTELLAVVHRILSTRTAGGAGV